MTIPLYDLGSPGGEPENALFLVRALEHKKYRAVNINLMQYPHGRENDYDSFSHTFGVQGRNEQSKIGSDFLKLNNGFCRASAKHHF